MASISEIIETLKARFDSDKAADITTVFQFVIEDSNDYFIAVENGAFSAELGEHDDPDVTLIMNLDTLTAIAKGETDGMQAFMSGQLKIEGDMMLATKIGDIFPSR